MKRKNLSRYFNGGTNVIMGSSGTPFVEMTGSTPPPQEVVSRTSPGEGWTKTPGTNIWAPPVQAANWTPPSNRYIFPQQPQAAAAQTSQYPNIPMQRNPNQQSTPPPSTSGSGRGYWKSGQDVEDLQNELVSQGYTLPKYGVDAKYGKETDAAFKEREADIAREAKGYGVDPGDMVYNNETKRFEPKTGAVNTEFGDTWQGDEGWDNKNYAWDEDNQKWLTEEEYNAKDWGDEEEVPEEKKIIEEGDIDAKKKWWQKLGVNQRDILGIIEGLTIAKSYRDANRANKKIGELRVDSQHLQPQTYNPELVDLSEAKKNAKELATAAVQRSQQEGRSTAETRALLTSGAEAQEKIAKTEAELQKQEMNIAKKANIEERRAVSEYNITNDRKDQIENNDTLASMYKNSIAISQNMRDAVLTKIKDVKLLNSAEQQMQVIGDAIAGRSGLDDRKFDDIIDNMINWNVITKEQGAELSTNYKALEKDKKNA